ncbi:hypothetical protein NERG_01195 [Nematocida ausubeli]|uniref:SAP domain-containing protein n=1 Tax=Nematocida ausubeli (strain ATCC PRA-371 / ERTm2) TaxID=1913371 RepID=H8ZBV2_NEMA1|nr:hypothetical protein NERG_01195 [Nematocida ausubeli]
MEDSDSDRNGIYGKTNTNRLFALDEFLNDNSDGMYPDASLSLSDNMQKILEGRKLYSFNHMNQPQYSPAYSEKSDPSSYIDAWYTKKRRRPYTTPWDYSPSEGEGYEREQAVYNPQQEMKKKKMCLGVLKKITIPQEKSTVNSVLPLYLNATTSFEGPGQRIEFLKISHNFMARVQSTDYNSLTVQQLKSIMKEFGLPYVGRKHELIERILQTVEKIQKKQNQERNGRKINVSSEMDDPKDNKQEGDGVEDKTSLGFMFF